MQVTTPITIQRQANEMKKQPICEIKQIVDTVFGSRSSSECTCRRTELEPELHNRVSTKASVREKHSHLTCLSKMFFCPHRE